MKNWIFFVISLLLASACLKSRAQSVNFEQMNPLFTFLQNTFDSSVIVYTSVPRHGVSKYCIVSKAGSRTFFFTYENHYTIFSQKGYPTSVRNFFLEKSLHYKSSIPDTNMYFYPTIMDSIVTKDFWKDIVEMGIWEIKSGPPDIYPCKDSSNFEHEIYDGTTTYFMLLTPKRNRQESFYAPHFYEKYCPGNSTLKKAIEINTKFKKYFN